MKKEQLVDKFIICRTEDELKFIKYWAEQLFHHHISERVVAPCTIRIQEKHCGFCEDIGSYEKGHTVFDCKKEEECSELFGNLVKRWMYENRT